MLDCSEAIVSDDTRWSGQTHRSSLWDVHRTLATLCTCTCTYQILSIA